MAKTPAAAASAGKKKKVESAAAASSSSSNSKKKKTTPKPPSSSSSGRGRGASTTASSSSSSPCYYDNALLLFEDDDDDRRRYYSSVELMPRRDKFMKGDPMLQPASFGRRNDDDDGEKTETMTTWSVGMGDLACAEVPSPSEMTDEERRRRRFPTGKARGRAAANVAPFAARWRPCQILCFYRRSVAGKNKLSTKKRRGRLEVEVRWFYRREDLDGRNRRHEARESKRRRKKRKKEKGGQGKGNDDGDDGAEELFESDHVARIDASALLGRLVFWDDGGGTPPEGCGAVPAGGECPVPTAIVGRPRRFYLHEEQDVIRLCDKREEEEEGGGVGGVLARGLACSGLLRRSDGARGAARVHLGLPPPPGEGSGDDDDDDDDDEYGDDGHPPVTLPAPAKIFGGRADPVVVAYYASCSLEHRWSHLRHGDLLRPPPGRRDSSSSPEEEEEKWELCVGDVVAVHCDESTAADGADAIPSRVEWYPYRVPWSHAQVTAIYRTFDRDDDEVPETESAVVTSTSSSPEVEFEIRWYPRVSEARAVYGGAAGKKGVLERLEKISDDASRTAEEILEGRQVTVIDAGSLLGPVFVDDDGGDAAPPPGENEPALGSSLPRNRRTVCDAVWCDAEGMPFLRYGGADRDPRRRVERAFEASQCMRRSAYLSDIVRGEVLRGREERAERWRKAAAAAAAAADNRRSMAGGEVAGAKAAGGRGAGRGIAGVAGPSPNRRRGSPHEKRRLFWDGESNTAENSEGKGPLLSTNDDDRVSANRGEAPRDGVLVDGPEQPFPTSSATSSEVARDHGGRSSSESGDDVIDGGDDDIDAEPIQISQISLPAPAHKDAFAYYASCALHCRVGFPKWQMCVGDVVAVHCEESTPPASGGWHPHEVPWSHAQVTAIYRTFDKKDEIPEGESSVMAPDVQCEIRWFPRVSEALAMCCAGKKKVLDRLEMISNDANRTVKEILEGRQVSTIDATSLLGPIFIDEEYSDTAPTFPKFLPWSKRTVCDAVWCDAAGKPLVYACDPTQRVERGFKASKLFKNKKNKLVDLIYKAVIQSRDERAEQVVDDVQFTMAARAMMGEAAETKAARDAGIGDSDSTGDAGPIDCEGSPRKKRQLLNDDSGAEISQNKRLRSSKNNDVASVEKKNAPQGKNKPARTVHTYSPRSHVKEEERPTPTPPVSRVRCRADPFHVDVSALKSFHKEVEITPPVDSYDGRFFVGGGANEEKGAWNVKLGDTVTIRFEQSSKDSTVVHFPFKVPWAPAEVVSIYRVHKKKESCARLRELVSNKDQQTRTSASRDFEDGDVMIEVRWFYRHFEIPGASKKKSESLSSGELEEVFETDVIDNCSADSILSPVRLHDVTKLQNPPSTILGMPCINYHCSRLWSIHRRSFVPSGSLSNRVSRGRMHSAFRAALKTLQPQRASSAVGAASSGGEKPWTEAFQSAIQQLSLAEAAESAQEGMVLACREKERGQITTFLRKAICGLTQRSKNDGQEEEDTKNLKSSMFIAGPPGTGKTASVRSVIAELQREQHEGLLPEFNFIALNGMELRHPFDAYVKCWEAISGTRKEKVPAGDAVNNLEHYFCGDQDQESDDSDEEEDEQELGDVNMTEKPAERPVTVLMLDELDYLVTKKETLVYNFFDWPLRATTARLVVIGISNTITLPEKMSTRVQSRIGGNRCYFKSYNVEDTMTILKTRLGMLDGSPGYLVFEEDAIKFAARKTANISGDIRKAFQMCKVAAETVYEDHKNSTNGTKPTVRISDIQKSSRDTFTSIVIKAVSCSSDYDALFLIALGALKKTRDDGMFTAKEVLTKIESIADASGEHRYMEARLSFNDVLRMMNRLGSAGIIQLTTLAISPWPWISTHLHSVEILGAFRDTDHSKLAEKHLAEQRLF